MKNNRIQEVPLLEVFLLLPIPLILLQKAVQIPNLAHLSLYAHLDKFNNITQKIPSSNTKRASGSTGSYTLKTKNVKKGGTLGYIGMTGNATGVHLHFEVWKNGKRTDPSSVIKGLV
ncbi:MAG: M23 family metallopeptidase [Lachnospiraceae bacterium]